MLELVIIKELLTKEVYNKYISLIKEPQELKKHYNVLKELHSSVSGDLSLQEYLLHAEQAGCDFLDVLKESEVGHESIGKLIKTLTERSWAHTLAQLSIEVSEGHREVSDVHDHYSKLSETEEKQCADDFVTRDLRKLMTGTLVGGKLQWRLPDLQTALGGLDVGDFGFVFARPEVGKTSFLVSEFTHMSRQTDQTVIWFNNEESGKKVGTRLYQGALGLTDDELKIDYDSAIQRFNEEFPNIQLVDSTPMNRRDIERILATYNPALIVIDQIDKVGGFKSNQDREDVMLGKIYIWAREMAKRYCPIIGVCQASASAENKRWLTMEDVAKSKTEKAAEADFMVGIGKTMDVGMEDIRFLHIIKNKLIGGHDKIECRIDSKIARYNPI